MIKFILPILLLLFVGCGTTTPANKSPIAKILADDTAGTSQQVLLDAIMSTDSDGKIVAYKWTDQAQNDLGTTRKVTWRAPARSGKYRLTLTVTDDDGATDSNTFMITVTKQNIRPSAVIKTSKKSTRIFQEVILDASDSTDNDGNITTYHWSDGSNEKVRSWIAHKAGTYRVSLTVTDNNGATNTTSVSINAAAPEGEFSKIKTLLLQAKAGDVNDAHYICVGDSTRAEGEPYYGGFVFTEIKEALNAYNVDSHLNARANHEAKQFNKESNNTTPIVWPTWDRVVDKIPDDGHTTIVDISLGINDLWQGGSIASIKQELRESIEKIKAQRAETLFMLTMPFSRKPSSVTAREYSDILKGAYKGLSYDLDLPLVDIQDAMTFNEDKYRDDNISFHLIQSAQKEVAGVIKDAMLP